MKSIQLILLIQILAFSVISNAQTVKILLMGDTQKTVNQDPNAFQATMDKILTDTKTKDADLLLHMGDMTEDNLDSNWDIFQAGFYKLDGKMPYVMTVGNNDMASDGSTAKFNEHFPLSKYQNWPSFLSNYEENTNNAHVFNIGGIDWLIISMKKLPSPEILSWAENLIINNPDKKVIILNHDLVKGDSEAMLLGRKYGNVVLGLGGHWTPCDRELFNGDNGNLIGRIRTCHHNKEKDSYLCILEINVSEGTIAGSYYSPLYGQASPLVGDTPFNWSGFEFGKYYPDICTKSYSSPNLSFSNETKTWSSGDLDISCTDDVAISMDIEGLDNLTLESDDYLNIYYKLDGGTKQILSTNTGAFAKKSISSGSINGDILELIIEVKNTASDEIYNVSNILIEDQATCHLPYNAFDKSISRNKITWTSGAIDISCVAEAKISMEIMGANSSTMESDDYLNIYYKVDGGSQEILSNNNGDFAKKPISKTGIIGNMVEIIIQGETSANDEVYSITNICLEESMTPSVIVSSETQPSALIYPNPINQDLLTIELTGNERMGVVGIDLYNLLGQLVYSNEYHNQNYIQIDTQMLQRKTAYIIAVKTKSTYYTEKLIIK